MDDAVARTVFIDDREITYFLERKKVKNLNLRIHKNGSVFVSANAEVPIDEIDEFVSRK